MQATDSSPSGPVPPSASSPSGPDRQEGFFQEYLSRLRTSLSPEEWREFSALGTTDERVTFVGRLPGAADPQWMVDLSWGRKDAAEAKAFKDKGNQAFLKGDFFAALELYSKCVLKTPHGDEYGTAELSVATANRSAALYRLGKYRRALEDIETALAMDFPKGLRHKVLDRKARCLLALSERRKYNQEASRRARDAAMAALRETLTALDEATDLDAERRAQRETDVRLMLCLLTKGAEEAAAAANRAHNKPSRRSEATEQVPVNEAEEDDEESGCGGHSGPLPAPVGGRHPLYPGASKNITFARRGKAGRQAEAKAVISPGDILVSEKPLSAVLLRQKTSTHCFQCFKPLLAPVPCPSCSTVSFCSMGCRNVAMETHHGTECGALPMLWASGSSLTCHIAVRLISQQNIQFFRDLRSHIKEALEAVAAATEDTGADGGGEGGTRMEEKVFWASELNAAQKEYLSVLRLVTHEKGRSAEDHFQRAVMAVFLVKCLREWGDFFEDTQAEEEPATETANGDTLNEDDILIGSLLVHHLQMAQFNAHEIFELEVGGEGEQRPPSGSGGKGGEADMISEDADAGVWRSVGLGGALFPCLALFNHSCEPGVIRYFKGNSVIVKAIRGANPGDMIAENYGPIYTRNNLRQRQTQLRTRYWFDCECRPCKENWPLFEEMPEAGLGPLRFRCPSTLPPPAAGNKPNPKAGTKPTSTSCSQGYAIVQTDTMAPVANCNECGANVNVIKGLKVLSETGDIFSKAEDKLKSMMSQGSLGAGRNAWRSQIEESLTNFLKVLRSLESVLAPPFRDIALCQQSARRCMLALGNVRQCANKSIATTNGVIS